MGNYNHIFTALKIKLLNMILNEYQTTIYIIVFGTQSFSHYSMYIAYWDFEEDSSLPYYSPSSVAPNFFCLLLFLLFG